MPPLFRTATEWHALMSAWDKVEDDSVRYYRVCRDCVEQSRVVGPTPLTTDPDYYIV